MKRISLIVLAIAAFTKGILQIQSGIAQRQNNKEAMRFKLHYSQGVLEAIATENFSLLATNSQKLKKLSQQADWQVRQTPEYQKFTADFARHAQSLTKAAETENTDAATVAYFQLTVSCVNCHRSLKGAREANLSLPGERIANAD